MIIWLALSPLLYTWFMDVPLAKSHFWVNLPTKMHKQCRKKMNDDDFVGKIVEPKEQQHHGSKNSIHFCCQRNSIKKKERETSTISISKVGNWVFISKSFLLLDLLPIFEEDHHHLSVLEQNRAPQFVSNTSLCIILSPSFLLFIMNLMEYLTI